MHFVLQFFNCVYCIRDTPQTRMAGGLPDFTRPAVFLSARFVCEVFDDFFGADGHPLRAVSRVSSSGKSAARTRPLSPTTGDAPTAGTSGASLILPHKTGAHARARSRENRGVRVRVGVVAHDARQRLQHFALGFVCCRVVLLKHFIGAVSHRLAHHIGGQEGRAACPRNNRVADAVEALDGDLPAASL